jgi:hypothetical protein
MLLEGCIGQQPAVVCIPGTFLKQVMDQSAAQTSYPEFLSGRARPRLLTRLRRAKASDNFGNRRPHDTTCSSIPIVPIVIVIRSLPA